MTEQEYRRLPYYGYSALKRFDEDRGGFYKEYILRQGSRDEKKSYAKDFGSLVDCLLFTRQNFDDKFILVQNGVIPPGQMQIFVENLWKNTRACLDEEGVVTKTMAVLLRESYEETCYNRKGERVAFKGKSLEHAIDLFNQSGRRYYDYLRNSHGKTVIDSAMIEAAENTVQDILNSPTTGPILKMRPSERFDIYHQLPIIFTYREMTLKSLVDFLYVDHQLKVIYPFDLKTSGWDTGKFDVQILKNRYYLQWSLYYRAIQSWAREEGLGEYAIEPMKFFVISADRTEAPLIYTTSREDLKAGLKGFQLKNGRKYKGTDQLIDEVKWHVEMDVWKMSKEDYENNGIRKVSLFEEE